jgi:hypothetical protein
MTPPPPTQTRLGFPTCWLPGFGVRRPPAAQKVIIRHKDLRNAGASQCRIFAMPDLRSTGRGLSETTELDKHRRKPGNAGGRAKLAKMKRADDSQFLQ